MVIVVSHVSIKQTDNVARCRYSMVNNATNSTLQQYIGEGNNRQARLMSQMVATRLNRLPAVNMSQACTYRRHLRIASRLAMLSSLGGLPIRDEVLID